MIKDYKPELLAPAGNLTCALAAYDAGADAVYAGLPKFNARERSDNFTMEQFGALIAYARRNNKKVYLTLNTLIKEIELKDLIELLAEVAYLRPDAVIVQDLGVVQAIRTYFPELVIHASTQMGIHNSAGVMILEKLGVSRVILERQVTVEELEEIMSKTTMEVEVFVHGALCCSLSGTCTFSSWLGGWSGNRGKCKQPCRRRFFADDGNGFFFSSQDLYTLDMIEKFKQLGVASFKIEGRMKKPDYIRATVTAYKKVIDAAKVDDVILNDARNELSKAAGRKWSHGFYTAESMEELIQHRQLGVSGTLCGDVISSESGRSFQVKVTRRLHIGDRIRLQSRTGDEAPSMTITKMFVNNKASNKAIKGEICSIPYDREVAYDAQVYRVGVATEDMDSRIQQLPTFKPVIDLDIKLDSKKLTIAVKEFPVVWEHDVAFAWAENRPCDANTLIEAFKATGDSNFILGATSVTIEGDWFVPKSVLKPLRKLFWQWLNEEFTPEQLRGGHPGLLKFYQDYNKLIPEDGEEINRYDSSFEREVDTYLVKPESHLPPKQVSYCRSIFSYDKKTNEVELPSFCSELRLANIDKAVERAYKDGIRKFRVTSLYQFALLEKYQDIQIAVASPFPVCNSLAVRALAELGATKVQAWVELNKNDMDRLVMASPIRIEIYRYGRFPLLVTRAKVPVSGKIKDNRANRFIVRFDKFSHLTNVYAAEAVKIEKINNTDNLYDLTNASWGDRDTSTFNFDKEMM